MTVPYAWRLRNGKPPAKVTLTYADGSTVCHYDAAAKAELFDKLLASLDDRGLLQLSQSISELRLSRAAEQLAQKEQAQRFVGGDPPLTSRGLQ